MGSFASAVVRLVGPFHCSWLAAKKTFIRVCIQTDSICCRSGGLLFRLDFFWMDYCFDRPRTRNRTIPRAFEQALDCARRSQCRRSVRGFKDFRCRIDRAGPGAAW
jgi:hypothetical protein